MAESIVCLNIQTNSEDHDYSVLNNLLNDNGFPFYDATYWEQGIISKNPTLDYIKGEYECK